CRRATAAVTAKRSSRRWTTSSTAPRRSSSPSSIWRAATDDVRRRTGGRMKLDVYLKTVLTVIAAALVVIAIHLSAERLSPSAAQAQSTNDDAAMDPSASPPATATLDSVTSRVSALERTQKEQRQRLEALRAAMP